MRNLTCPNKYKCYDYMKCHCDGCNDCDTDFNKPKMILVGMTRNAATQIFFNHVLEQLIRCEIDVTDLDRQRFRFKTPHTEVWFVDDYYAKYFLEGIRPAAIFGELYPELLAIVRKNTLISSHDRIGLVDYICQVEREASESRKVLLKIGEAFHAGFTHGMSQACEKRVTDTWVGDMWPEMYITMPPRNGKSLYRHVLNSLYGKFPKRPELTAEWVQEVFDEAVKNGTIKTSLTKFRDISSEDIEQVLKQSDHLIQMKLYAALMKGENNMPTEAARNYVRQDFASLAEAFKRVNDAFNKKLPGIKTVHFSGPVTAVIWEDKTKTIVRCKDGDVPDYEKGLAMAIAKKALGTNKSGSNYYDIFKKWLPKPEIEDEE